MSSERKSTNNRMTKVARSVKKKFASLLQPSRPRTPSSIDVDSRSDNNMAITHVGTSNVPFDYPPSSPVPTVSINRAPDTMVATTELEPPPPVPMASINRALDTTAATTETEPMSLPISIPVSASIPDMPIQVSSGGSLVPETPPTHLFLPNIGSPTPLFQNARNVYMHQPRITIVNNAQNVSNASRNGRSKAQTLNALSEKLLPRAQFAEYDAASPAPRNACTKDTRKIILETLQVWANNRTATKVYWLNGMAGTGKTTIAYSFSEILREKDSLGGTFFASHLRVDTSDVRCIIPTISLQLARHIPSLSHLILDVVEDNPDCSSWKIGKQFLNFIVRPLTNAYKDRREVVVVPVIVLDALDECSDQSFVAELVSVILKHSTSLPVKFFITSRPEIVLKESFDQSWAHSYFILHEVEKEIVKADIELYIKACLFDGQRRLNRHDWPSQAELERLVSMAGVLFIYAATVCKYVVQRGSLSMPQRLSAVVNFTLETSSGITQPLDLLYERILDAAHESANQMERSDISTVLEAVIYVYNPLSMPAISVLVQMPIERVGAALSSLHSLIYIPSSQHLTKPISILHTSFYDFISNQIQSSKYYLDPCASHEHLALQCLFLMEKEWSQKRSVSYLAERKCGDISESLVYACASWAFHFTHSNHNRCAELKQFFENYLLHWMDCLSIAGKLGTAMISLQRLKKWANTQKLLMMMIIDAEHFLKENFDFIKQNSLEGCPSALAWLPEQSHIWKAYGSKICCPWELCIGRRKAWSLCEAVLRHSAMVNFAVFSPDGMHIVSTSYSYTVQIWNAVTGEYETELKGHSGYVKSAVFSPDSMHIVSASDDQTARIWNTATGECEAELKGHSGNVNSAVFSPDGMHIVSASSDKTAWIWNVTTGECEAQLKGHSGSVKSAVFSPNNMHVVSASDDQTAQIWNAATGECEAELKGHSDNVTSAVFSPDGMHIVSASYDYTARIWNTVTGECEVELKGHLNAVVSAVFSPDGMHIVSASYDYTARIWNTATGECEAELKGHSGNVNSAIFSPDGMHIVSASHDETARVWNAATGECEANLKGHSFSVNSAVFSPDGMHIVSASYDSTARIWNAITEGCEADMKGHSDNITSAVFSSDGMHIVSASHDYTAQIWNTTTGECEVELKGHSSRVNSAVFSPDGLHIVSASNDQTARVWNVATGECEAVLKGHTFWVNSAAFSFDSMYIVSASFDKTARIWNAVTQKCEIVLKGHLYSVNSAVFSPDGLHIVSASHDQTARIWNTATGECEAVLEGHSSTVDSVVFSSDGVHIVSASSDQTVHVWNAATGQCEAKITDTYSLPLNTSLDGNIQLPVSSTIPYGFSVHMKASNTIHFSFPPSFLDSSGDTIFHIDTLQKIQVPTFYHNPSSVSFHLFKICLGYKSGEVLLLKFQL